MTLFPLGKLMITPGAIKTLEAAGDSPFRYLARHGSADWGQVDTEDWKANDDALLDGNLRILSAYQIRGGQKVWVLTEADHRSTTILLPEEY